MGPAGRAKPTLCATANGSFLKRHPAVPSQKRNLGLLVTLAMRRADRCPTSLCGTSAQAILKNLGWRFYTMAKLVYRLNQSLDGYVDHLEFGPNLALFRHFIEHVRDLTGIVYGGLIDEHRLYLHPVIAVIRGLTAQLVGEVEVAGPVLAGSLTDLLGRGKPFFAGPRPPLRLVTSHLLLEDLIRLTYVPA
jgi:hypothetical protein